MLTRKAEMQDPGWTLSDCRAKSHVLMPILIFPGSGSLYISSSSAAVSWQIVIEYVGMLAEKRWIYEASGK
jgi:hypothetical protein